MPASACWKLSMCTIATLPLRLCGWAAQLLGLACSAACINLCRDEITQILKHKIDQVYGSSFNINGLGAVLTCGVTGMGAGLSHSPVDEVGALGHGAPCSVWS